MGWTPELIKDLKKLWNKGLTTVEIGNRLGMSKIAIVGKAHRLGLEGRPSPIKRETKKEHTAPRMTKKAAPVSPKAAPAPADVHESKDDLPETSFLPPDTIFEAEPIVEKPISSKRKHKGVLLVDLKPNSCRWPEGDPKDPNFRFCGQECAEGKIYCEEHCAVAYSGVFKAR